jgi:hypothetical protein
MFLVTSGIGFLLAVMKGIYKSKCKSVSCCCLKIERDIEAEIEVDEMTLQRQTSSKDEKDSNIQI